MIVLAMVKEDRQKVYAIYTGCRFEGGAVEDIYKDKETAIKFALMRLQEEKQRTAEVHQERASEWEWKEIGNIHPESKAIKIWQNPVDEIIVFEYDLK